MMMLVPRRSECHLKGGRRRGGPSFSGGCKGADGPRHASARFLLWAAWRRVRGGKSGAGMLGLGWAPTEAQRPGFPVVLG